MENKIKNIIFDLDGTLWDSRATIIENWNEVLLSKNHLFKPLELSDMNPYMGLLADDILRELIPGISNDEIFNILETINQNENKAILEHGGVLYPKVEDVLKKLAQTMNLFIVSNCQDGYIEAFLEFFQFSGYFQDFESYGRTGQEKMKNIEAVIKRNNLIPAETIYVGDTTTDYQAATANDLKFIFCIYGFGEMKESNNSIRINSITELLDFV